MNHAPARVQTGVCDQPLDRARAESCGHLGHLLGALGGVDVNRAGGAHGEQGLELGRVDGTQAVGCGADAQKRVLRGVPVEGRQQRQVLVPTPS